MKPFTVFDPRTGKILRSGSCQDHMVSMQARPGESVLPITSDPRSQSIDLKSMKAVNVTIDDIPTPNYRMLRQREYPEVGEQLDVLWREMQALPLTQEADAMLKRIQAVKAKYPKQ